MSDFTIVSLLLIRKGKQEKESNFISDSIDGVNKLENVLQGDILYYVNEIIPYGARHGTICHIF